MITTATPDNIKVARALAGLSQPQAAALISVHPINWSKYERGVTAIAPAAWELFLIKVDQHPEYGRKEVVHV